MKRFALFSLSAAFSVSALAHPGHSTLAATLDEWIHLLLSPDHLFGTIIASLVLLGVAAAGAQRLARKERRDDSR